MTFHKKRDRIKIFNSILVNPVTQIFEMDELKSSPTPIAAGMSTDRDVNISTTEVSNHWYTASLVNP